MNSKFTNVGVTVDKSGATEEGSSAKFKPLRFNESREVIGGAVTIVSPGVVVDVPESKPWYKKLVLWFKKSE